MHSSFIRAVFSHLCHVWILTVPKHYFTNREFSFTLKDDVYIRYQSFSDQQDFEKELQKKCPYKIDIGAVYSHRVWFTADIKIQFFYSL